MVRLPLLPVSIGCIGHRHRSDLHLDAFQEVALEWREHINIVFELDDLCVAMMAIYLLARTEDRSIC